VPALVYDLGRNYDDVVYATCLLTQRPAYSVMSLVYHTLVCLPVLLLTACLQLEYFPVAGDSNSSCSINTAAAAASSPAAKPVRRLSETGEEQQGMTRAAKVSDDIDRDKVR
jgi:hypothetical protein